jgi:hypothetical protein
LFRNLVAREAQQAIPGFGRREVHEPVEKWGRPT